MLAIGVVLFLARRTHGYWTPFSMQAMPAICGCGVSPAGTVGAIGMRSLREGSFDVP